MPAPKLLREACVPRDEVLSGELRDEMFAARLSDVVQGKAHRIYQDPDLFYANTYPTERVRSFLREVMGRLSGADKTASAFFRLDTPFGGGKTHTLIALYHLASSPPSSPVLQRLGVDPRVLPREKVKVVSVVGDDLSPADGVEKDGVRIHHLWGEIAFQLGGRSGYSLVERSDTQGLAPGPQFLDRLIGRSPTLILIDEPAAYMRKMGGSAGQLPVFLKMLAEWVTTAASRTVLVLTLAWNPQQRQPSSQDAFARENQELAESLEATFREVQSVVNRPARIVTPAERGDIEPILRQRLFKLVEPGAASAVADSYFDALRQAHQRGVSLPAAVVQASFREGLERAYPFHPSLIEVLDGKLATIPNFQRTRGALRLLTRVIRRMWGQGQTQGHLIHPFSVDLSDPDIVDELTGRLDRPAFRSVATYDVARPDGQSHAQTIDQERFSGHAPYTQRVATTIFLHSLVEPPARGADLEEIMAATLTPDADPAHIGKSLQYLAEEAWHLDFEGRRYFFRTEPSLNKIVVDETQNIPHHEARSEVERRIRQLWRTAGLEVKYFPNDPSELPNEPKGRLVLMHWDTTTSKPGEPTTPTHVQELGDYAGAQRDFRTFRNALFFLVADSDRHERMVNVTRRWLALDGLLRDTRKLDEYKLGKEHRQRLKEWKEEAELQVRVAITSAYRHLFYPKGTTGGSSTDYDQYTLQIQDQGETRVNHTETVLRVLREELQKVKTADDPIMPAALVKRDTFGANEGSVPLKTLYERFAERPRLPLLLEPTYLKEVVKLGIKNKDWLYYDSAQNLAYDTVEPLTDIVIDNQHEVMLPEEVRRRNIPVYRKPGAGDGGPKGPKPTFIRGGPPTPVAELAKAQIEVEGEPRRALADLAAQAKDARWLALGSLELRWQGDGRDAQARLSAIGTILGQVPGTEAKVSVSLSCEYADGASFEAKFDGPAARYSPLASTLEGQVGQARDAHAEVVLTLEFASPLPLEGPEYQDLRDSLDLANLPRTRITGKRAAGAP